jgi:hypothetical protein
MRTNKLRKHQKIVLKKVDFNINSIVFEFKNKKKKKTHTHKTTSSGTHEMHDQTCSIIIIRVLENYVVFTK